MRGQAFSRNRVNPHGDASISEMAGFLLVSWWTSRQICTHAMSIGHLHPVHKLRNLSLKKRISNLEVSLCGLERPKEFVVPRVKVKRNIEHKRPQDAIL